MDCICVKGLLPAFPPITPPPSFLFIAGFETTPGLLLSEGE